MDKLRLILDIRKERKLHIKADEVEILDMSTKKKTIYKLPKGTKRTKKRMKVKNFSRYLLLSIFSNRLKGIGRQLQFFLWSICHFIRCSSKGFLGILLSACHCLLIFFIYQLYNYNGKSTMIEIIYNHLTTMALVIYLVSVGEMVAVGERRAIVGVGESVIVGVRILAC